MIKLETRDAILVTFECLDGVATSYLAIPHLKSIAANVFPVLLEVQRLLKICYILHFHAHLDHFA